MPAAAALRVLAAAALVAAAWAPGRALGAVGCRDMQGNPVDWFAAYKIPEVDAYPDGLGFAYMDANGGGALKETGVKLSSSSHAIAHTLQQIYGNAGSPSMAYLMYNDETPDEKASGSRGHTKGEVAYDSQTGFWLIHSVPRWPNKASDGYDFPERETRYGQSFLCLSLRAADFELVAQQMLFTFPQVYDHNLPASLAPTSTRFAQIIDNQHTSGSPYTSIQPLSTLGGVEFVSFAKNSAWMSDLYEELVAPELRDDLRTETWQNGRGKMSSYCKPAKTYSVENVEHIAISANAAWKSTKDHSKIALSTPRTGFACIGGINRQTSQAHRGGGTVCSNNRALYQAFNAVVADIESC